MHDEHSESNSPNNNDPNISNTHQKNKSSEDLEMNIEEDESLATLKKAITLFLSEHTIYEAIPEDMKILVFNDELLIKDSIEAMIKEDIYCGLLYNSEQNKHSGIFTIRDVLGLLLIGYKKLVLFLNTRKDITSYEILKENQDKFFATFDTNEGNNNNNIINANDELIISKGLENKEINNNDGMEIEEEKSNNNINNNINKKITEKEITEEESKAYNNIIKDFNQFIQLFNDITLQSFIGLFHMKDNVSLISLFSESNLEKCVKTIQNNNIHRLIVNDKKTNNLSGFITIKFNC